MYAARALPILFTTPQKSLLKLSYPKKYLPNFRTQKKSENRKFQTQKNPSIIPITWNPECPPGTKVCYLRGSNEQRDKLWLYQSVWVSWPDAGFTLHTVLHQDLKLVFLTFSNHVYANLTAGCSKLWFLWGNRCRTSNTHKYAVPCILNEVLYCKVFPCYIF